MALHNEAKKLGKKVISNSQIKSYKQCPHKWKTMYIDGNKEYQPSIFFVFGTAIHETLQEFLRVMYSKTAKAAEEFISRLNDEVIMRETSKGILSGSQTAMRQAIVGTVKAASKRDPIQGFTQLVQQAISKDFKTIADEQESTVAAEIAKVLVEQNPDKLDTISKDLTNKGLRKVLRNYAPQVAPRLLNLLINPSQISARTGTATSQGGFGQAINLENLLPQGQ